MARRESARSAQQDCFRQESCSPFDQAMAKQRRSAVPAAAMHLATPRREAKSQAQARLLVAAGWRLRLLELKDSPLRRVMEIRLVRARARQYLRDPDPFAFFREIPDAEKYNPAARSGDLPIFARYH